MTSLSWLGEQKESPVRPMLPSVAGGRALRKEHYPQSLAHVAQAGEVLLVRMLACPLVGRPRACIIAYGPTETHGLRHP